MGRKIFQNPKKGFENIFAPKSVEFPKPQVKYLTFFDVLTTLFRYYFGYYFNLITSALLFSRKSKNGHAPITGKGALKVH